MLFPSIVLLNTPSLFGNSSISGRLDSKLCKINRPGAVSTYLQCFLSKALGASSTCFGDFVANVTPRGVIQRGGGAFGAKRYFGIALLFEHLNRGATLHISGTGFDFGNNKW